MQEIWKDIKGYEGLYQVSNLGRIKSLPKAGNHWNGKILAQNYNRKYARIGLSKGKLTTENVHRLVAMAFIPNPLNLPEVNHKDENPSNNRVDNLEWVTHKENMDYGTQIKRGAISRGIPTIQYSYDGKFIREWHSIAEAARGIRPDSYVALKTEIARVCNGEKKHALGFIWKWKYPHKRKSRTIQNRKAPMSATS